MGNKYNTVASHAENTWRDKRTGLLLAPGAVKNWPTIGEEEQIKRDRKWLAELLRAEQILREKKLQKANHFES